MTEEKTRNLIPADLNEGQKEAFTKMRDFIEKDSGTMFLLEGYAGTGKTYLVGKLLKLIFDKHSNWKVAVTAPTNKAVKVLKKSSNIKNPRVEFQTIHKLLGLTEEITSEGKQIFTRKDYGSENSIDEFDLVIVDEVSMLNDELFVELNMYKDEVIIIFMGDPAQIPPVNKQDCIPFIPEKRDEFKIENYRLTEIMRQGEDNPIINTSFIIRNDLSAARPEIVRATTLNDKGHGIVFIDFNKKEDRDNFASLLNTHFNCDEFRANPDFAKVIAWRNVTVDNMNTIIRKMIYGADPNKIMIGEKLLANKPITDPALNAIIFNTNDEFEVASYTINHRRQGAGDESIKLAYYDALVLYTDILGATHKKTIQILHEDSETDFKKAVAMLKSDAIMEKDPRKRKKAWLEYYNFMRKFADVGYNYAITAHKSQGSTYKNTFIMEDDIDYNRNIYERNRIKYTAYTRPTDKLFIIKR